MNHNNKYSHASGVFEQMAKAQTTQLSKVNKLARSAFDPFSYPTRIPDNTVELTILKVLTIVKNFKTITGEDLFVMIWNSRDRACVRHYVGDPITKKYTYFESVYPDQTIYDSYDLARHSTGGVQVYSGTTSGTTFNIQGSINVATVQRLPGLLNMSYENIISYQFGSGNVLGSVPIERGVVSLGMLTNTDFQPFKNLNVYPVDTMVEVNTSVINPLYANVMKAPTNGDTLYEFTASEIPENTYGKMDILVDFSFNTNFIASCAFALVVSVYKANPTTGARETRNYVQEFTVSCYGIFLNVDKIFTFDVEEEVYQIKLVIVDPIASGVTMIFKDTDLGSYGLQARFYDPYQKNSRGVATMIGTSNLSVGQTITLNMVQNYEAIPDSELAKELGVNMSDPGDPYDLEIMKLIYKNSNYKMNYVMSDWVKWVKSDRFFEDMTRENLMSRASIYSDLLKPLLKVSSPIFGGYLGGLVGEQKRGEQIGNFLSDKVFSKTNSDDGDDEMVLSSYSSTRKDHNVSRASTKQTRLPKKEEQKEFKPMPEVKKKKNIFNHEKYDERLLETHIGRIWKIKLTNIKNDEYSLEMKYKDGKENVEFIEQTPKPNKDDGEKINETRCATNETSFEDEVTLPNLSEEDITPGDRLIMQHDNNIKIMCYGHLDKGTFDFFCPNTVTLDNLDKICFILAHQEPEGFEDVDELIKTMDYVKETVEINLKRMQQYSRASTKPEIKKEEPEEETLSPQEDDPTKPVEKEDEPKTMEQTTTAKTRKWMTNKSYEKSQIDKGQYAFPDTLRMFDLNSDAHKGNKMYCINKGSTQLLVDGYTTKKITVPPLLWSLQPVVAVSSDNVARLNYILLTRVPMKKLSFNGGKVLIPQYWKIVMEDGMELFMDGSFTVLVREAIVTSYVMAGIAYSTGTKLFITNYFDESKVVGGSWGAAFALLFSYAPFGPVVSAAIKRKDPEDMNKGIALEPVTEVRTKVQSTRKAGKLMISCTKDDLEGISNVPSVYVSFLNPTAKGKTLPDVFTVSEYSDIVLCVIMFSIITVVTQTQQTNVKKVVEGRVATVEDLKTWSEKRIQNALQGYNLLAKTNYNEADLKQAIEDFKNDVKPEKILAKWVIAMKNLADQPVAEKKGMERPKGKIAVFVVDNRGKDTKEVEFISVAESNKRMQERNSTIKQGLNYMKAWNPVPGQSGKKSKTAKKKKRMEIFESTQQEEKPLVTEFEPIVKKKGKTKRKQIQLSEKEEDE